jgi:hypothetical protein
VSALTKTTDLRHPQEREALVRDIARASQNVEILHDRNRYGTYVLC